MQTKKNGINGKQLGALPSPGFFESLRIFLTDYQQLKIVQGEGAHFLMTCD